MAEADLCLILNGCYDRRSIRQADRNLTPTRTVDVRYKYPAAVVFVPGDKSTIFFRDLDRHPTCFAPVCTSEHCPIRLRPIHHNPLGLDSLGYSIEGKTSWDLMRLVTVYDDVFHPPPGAVFPSSIAPPPRLCQECHIPNDTSSESSRRDVSSVRHRHYSNCGDIDRGNIGPGGASVICTVVPVCGNTRPECKDRVYSILVQKMT